MLKVSFKHNVEEIARNLLDDLTVTIRQSKKEMHQRAADIIKEDIKEHYDEEFQKVVDPNSPWQQLKESLGLPSKPGHFTGSTLKALVAEATEEMGQVMLKGKWPSLEDLFLNNQLIEMTPSGMRIKSFRDKTTGIQTGRFLIPVEDLSTKRFGSWINEDITFMKLRPDAEKKVVDDMMTFLNKQALKVLADFRKRSG